MRPRRALFAWGRWAGMEGEGGGREEGAAATERPEARGTPRRRDGGVWLLRRPGGVATSRFRRDSRDLAGRAALPRRAGPTRAGRRRPADGGCRRAAPLPGDAPGAGRIGSSGSSRCPGASATSESGSLSLSVARSCGGGGRRRQGTGTLMRVGVRLCHCQDWKSRSDHFFSGLKQRYFKGDVFERVTHAPACGGGLAVIPVAAEPMSHRQR